MDSAEEVAEQKVPNEKDGRRERPGSETARLGS